MSEKRTASTAPATTSAVPPERRVWGPRIIIGLTLLLLAATWYGENVLERIPVAESHLVMLSAVALAVISLVIWFVVRSRAAWYMRSGVGILFLASIALAIALFRVDSVSGNVWPKLALRWTPKADRTLPPLPKLVFRKDPNIDRTLPPLDVDAPDSTIDLTATGPADYPQFLGPQRNATLPGRKLARDWQAQPPRRIWRHAVGAGWSSFAVVGDYAVTQEQRGDQELVTCYELSSGEPVWAHDDEVRFAATVGGIGPRSTPTIHEGRVYTMGAQGLVNCLRGEDGGVIWRVQAVPADKVPEWGKSCSPLVTGNLVIVSAGLPDGHSLVAYDKETGKEVWSGGDDVSGYSSPAEAKLAGRRQILIVNQNSIAAHDPDDGKVLWSHEWPSGSPNVSQSVPVGGDLLFVSKGYAVGCRLWQIVPQGEKLTVEELWQNRNLKTKFTNVVLLDNHVYGLDEGVLVCLDLASGKRKWKNGRYDHGQILLVGDLILVQCESGEVALVRATPESHQELTRFQAIEGKTWNNPVLSGRRLLVRNDTEMACYELPVEE